MTLANSVLDALIAGNTRFREGLSSPKPWQSANDYADQNPIAIILGCSDSRVPIEIIFDQGPGDLFVIRVAGNIVAPSQIGSVEFAALQFQVPLVVVMGHTRCGAIDATLHHMQNPGDHATDNLKSIVDRIAPSMTSLVEADTMSDQKALSYHCMRANVRASVNQLKHGSSALEGLIEASELQICGAYYDLDSGSVHFFE
ncbi:MAG: carbonic anhydrase [Gammaproteobacteria bacterium]|jgi:carbonic anhydrase|nr:carbonic anhydrase [Gammaproteobacteria bacterium]MBT5054336.1 carbonic anhydrase [Gammaproteobacteria bacterium]